MATFMATSIAGPSIAGIYVILDHPHPFGLELPALARALVESGARVLQLRAKHASTEERVAMLRTLVPIAAAASVPLLVNDDLAAARAVPGVAGIHLGQGDLDQLGPDAPARLRMRASLREDNLLLGLSTHDLGQVQAAKSLAPDYLGFGPVFSTRSKANPDPVVGLDLLGQAVAMAEVPVVAIGGIGPQQLVDVHKTKVAAIAVISAVIAPTLAGTRERCRALEWPIDSP